MPTQKSITSHCRTDHNFNLELQDETLALLERMEKEILMVRKHPWEDDEEYEDEGIVPEAGHLQSLQSQ